MNPSSGILLKPCLVMLAVTLKINIGLNKRVNFTLGLSKEISSYIKIAHILLVSTWLV